MHIAVCDDNVADRKQLERLLDRESDKRKAASGVFYTDSYGNPDALSASPMSYDLFFIDLVQSSVDGLTFARQLREGGVTAPIVLCSSKIDYPGLIRQTPKAYHDFLHLSKPILVANLSKTLDQASHMSRNKTPSIELRSNTESYYVREDDIMYAVSAGRYVHVTLRDRREIAILTDMINFYDEIHAFSHFVMLSSKSLVNVVYLESYSAFRVVLKNGTKLKSSPASVHSIKNALQMYHAEAL